MADTGGLAAEATSSSQSVTQNPQNSTQTASLGRSQNVQTGTSTSLLSSKNGIPLHGTTVTQVRLAATTIKTAPPTPTNTHATNPLLFGFSVLLFVVAIGLFWATSRPDSVKSTTK